MNTLWTPVDIKWKLARDGLLFNMKSGRRSKPLTVSSIIIFVIIFIIMLYFWHLQLHFFI